MIDNLVSFSLASLAFVALALIYHRALLPLISLSLLLYESPGGNQVDGLPPPEVHLNSHEVVIRSFQGIHLVLASFGIS